jgi:hypothetical protein
LKPGRRPFILRERIILRHPIDSKTLLVNNLVLVLIAHKSDPPQSSSALESHILSVDNKPMLAVFGRYIIGKVDIR